MEIRSSELLRRAQAGDPAAVLALVEQYQASAFRLALTILDDPGEAPGAAGEALHSLSDNLRDLSDDVALANQLDYLVLRACQDRMRQKKWAAWKERIWRRFGSQRADPDPAPLSSSPAKEWAGGDKLWEGFLSLDEEQRIVLVLRYYHDLLPSEMAQILRVKERNIFAHLGAAREGLFAALENRESASITGSREEDIHRRAHRWIQAATDHAISDADATTLGAHLEKCAACQAFSCRMPELEKLLRGRFHQRWDGVPMPPDGLVQAVLERRRQRLPWRKAMNLAGAAAATLLVVTAVMSLPTLRPQLVIPAPRTATPAAQLDDSLPPRRQVNPGSRITRPSDSTRYVPVPSYDPNFTQLSNNPDLLAEIYPGQLAFSTFDRVSSHVFTIRPDGRDKTPITTGSAANYNPVWSPDGRKIAYLSHPDGLGKNQVFIINADGSNPRQVSRPDFLPASTMPDGQSLAGYPSYGPLRWSPDGRWLAASLWLAPGISYLAVLPASIGDPRYLEVGYLDRWKIEWSPDGQTIAYIANDSRELWQWTPMMPEVAGRNPRRFDLREPWEMSFGLAWSPDGRSMAVLGGVHYGEELDIRLHLVSSSGRQGQISFPISSGLLSIVPTHDSGLAWSPDGLYLAYIPVFSDIDLFQTSLMLMRLDGSKPRLLARPKNGVSSFTWSPDGRWLAFSSGEEVWAASLAAIEQDLNAFVRITPSAGPTLSWQPVRPSAQAVTH